MNIGEEKDEQRGWIKRMNKGLIKRMNKGWITMMTFLVRRLMRGEREEGAITIVHHQPRSQRNHQLSCTNGVEMLQSRIWSVFYCNDDDAWMLWLLKSCIFKLASIKAGVQDDKFIFCPKSIIPNNWFKLINPKCLIPNKQSQMLDGFAKDCNHHHCLCHHHNNHLKLFGEGEMVPFASGPRLGRG